MSKKSDDRKNVVVVGGGGYGATLVHELSSKLDASKYNLIMISARPYYIHLVAAVRFTVTSEGKLEDRAFMPYEKLFVNGNGAFFQGKVTGINDLGKGRGGEVSLEDGQTVHYDALVLATGSQWSGPLDFPDANSDVHSELDAWRRKYTAANHIVFVGGGSVGIETAGEIRDAFPNKKVTIVHGSDSLLNDTYPPKFRKFMTNKVLDKGINVILGDRVESFPEEGTVGLTTSNGKSIPDADLVIPTFGARPNTGFISTLGSDVLTKDGYVHVDATLSIPKHEGIFAFGDIIDWPEQKQLGKAPGQVAVVLANLQSFLNNQKLAKLYKSPPEIIVIPIGKGGGGAYANILWGLVLGDWIVRTLKGKDLFISPYRKTFGLS
ncbi:hypothetical protein EUX98_g6183 [Antrodiella citrinella]|uniref:FAD/NAD(P)-binding domain-containing protein n=1 Tax=Antrodiella citrinella TaxID=2447956 RepID=A0A4S4MPL9_9APHY|nr:hypothetical protein EUX98_g6183 [Antrodiella citrinella]